MQEGGNSRKEGWYRLLHIVTCRSLIRWILVQMFGLIISWVTHLLLITFTHRQYSSISLIHQLQFTIAHVLGYTNCNSLTLQIFHVNQVLSKQKQSSQHTTRTNLSFPSTPCELTSITELAELNSYWLVLNWLWIFPESHCIASTPTCTDNSASVVEMCLPIRP
jgi:hypothetical protein